MPQPWLRSNRRAIAAGFLVPVVLIAIGLVLALWPWAWWLRILAIVPLGIAAVVAWSLWRLMRQPRLAYDEGHLLVYLSGSFMPEPVPIEVVECFFLGQAPSLLPQPGASASVVRAHAVVIRLAETAKQWHQRTVRRGLGQWCDGYITIRGTWSEPINPSLVQQLNARLLEVQRARRQQQQQVH